MWNSLHPAKGHLSHKQCDFPAQSVNCAHATFQEAPPSRCLDVQKCCWSQQQCLCYPHALQGKIGSDAQTGTNRYSSADFRVLWSRGSELGCKIYLLLCKLFLFFWLSFSFYAKRFFPRMCCVWPFFFKHAVQFQQHFQNQ